MHATAHPRSILPTTVALAAGAIGLVAAGFLLWTTGGGGEDGEAARNPGGAAAAAGPWLLGLGLLLAGAAGGVHVASKRGRRLHARIEAMASELEHMQRHLAPDRRLTDPMPPPLDGLERQINRLLDAIETRFHELEHSEQRLRLALDATSEGVWEMNPQSGQIWASPHLYRILGYDPEEPFTSTEEYENLVHPEDHEARRRTIEQHIRARSRQISMRYRVRDRHGTWRWILSRGRAVDFDEQGRPVRIIGTHTDITDHVAAQQALAESRQRLKTLTEHTPAHLYTYDPEAERLTSVNRRVADFCGQSAESLLAEPDRQLPHEVEPEHLQIVREARRRLASPVADNIVEFTIRARRHDGQVRWLRCWESVQPATVTRPDGDGDDGSASDTPAPPPQHGGRPGRLIVGAALDVTEQQHAEMMARHTERLAAMGTLAAGLAHEINNPLGAILIAAHVIQNHMDNLPEDEQSAEMREMAHQIVESGQRCARIVRNVLRFARQDQAGTQLHDVGEIIELAADLTRSYTAHRGAIVETACDPALPRVQVNATEIEQALINLIQNAAAANSRHIRIHAAHMPDAGMVRISVADDGCGMQPEEVDQAFTPFYTTRPDDGGTGLGMSICHGIVTGHRGPMSLQSTPGEGTTVHIDLPIAPER